MTTAAFDAAAAVSQVVTALLTQADSERARQAKRYLKSDLDFLGVSVPAIRSAVRDVARLAADRRVGDGRRLLGPPVRPAHAAARDQAGKPRPRAVRAVRHGVTWIRCPA